MEHKQNNRYTVHAGFFVVGLGLCFHMTILTVSGLQAAVRDAYRCCTVHGAAPGSGRRFAPRSTARDAAVFMARRQAGGHRH